MNKQLIIAQLKGGFLIGDQREQIIVTTLDAVLEAVKEFYAPAQETDDPPF